MLSGPLIWLPGKTIAQERSSSMTRDIVAGGFSSSVSRSMEAAVLASANRPSVVGSRVNGDGVLKRQRIDRRIDFPVLAAVDLQHQHVVAVVMKVKSL